MTDEVRAIDLVRRLLAQRALPQFADLGVEKGRQFIDERSRRLGPREDVDHVEDDHAPSDGPRDIPVRIYEPSQMDGGCLVYMHGGGWVFGDLDTSDAQCRILANAACCRVISVDYALAPEHPFPAALQQVRDVLEWVASGFGRRHEAGPVAVGGESAGANLAAAAALLGRDLGAPDLAGVVLHYPILDAEATPCHRQFGDLNYLTARDMDWFWSQYEPDPAARSGAYHSPGRAAELTGLPPTYVLTAENDVLRDEGELFAARLVAAGVRTCFARADGATHGFLGWTSELPSARAWLERAGRWLREQLDLDI